MKSIRILPLLLALVLLCAGCAAGAAIAWLHGGGSFAMAAYYGLEDAVTVERVQAHAGIDIGDVLIGMQLKAVAVPVRVSQKTIGDAHVVCARTRPKYIGGERTHYAEDPEMRK